MNIDAPPEKVFTVLCDVERWPEWTSTMLSVQPLERGAFKVGSSARVRQPKLRPAVWTVTDLDENRSFTWVTSAAGVRMRAEHLIDARGDRSQVALEFKVSGLLGPLIALLYGGLIQRYLATEAQGLKRRSESADSR